MPKISQINYSIQFEPIFSKFTFNGTQVITLNTSSTNSFTLNAAELKITKCYLMYKGKSINTKFKLNPKDETLKIKFSKKISGKVKICIEFVG